MLWQARAGICIVSHNMGASISKLFSGLVWGKKDIRILILGLVGHQPANERCGSLMSMVGQCWQDNVIIQIEGEAAVSTECLCLF